MYKSQLIRTVFVELFWADSEALCEDFAGEWDHDLAAAGGFVTHKVSDSNVTTEREDVGRRSEGPARRLLSAGRSLISFSALGTRWSLTALAAGPAGPLRI